MKLRYLLLLTTCAALPAPAFAQGDAGQASVPDNVGLQDIVVTAQKQSSGLQKTAIAISAVSGDNLRTQQVTDVQGLARMLPSVDFGQTTGNARIAIRGVGFDNISLGNEGRVAYHMDGVYVARPAAALAGFYDVERVEVLRGPQGTLYGRNATGGAINIITAGPTDQVSGYIDLTYANYDMIKAEGAVGGPISDALSVRGSFQIVERDGYGRNITNGLDVDDLSTKALRGQIRYNPNETVDIRLSADYFTENDHAYSLHYIRPGSIATPATATTPALPGLTPKGLLFGGVVPVNPRDSSSDNGPFNSREFYNFSANAKFDLGAVVINSITGYRHNFFHTASDLDATSARLNVYDQYEKSHSISQELRFSGSFGKSQWMIGGYYFNEDYFGGTRIPADLAIFAPLNQPLPALTGFKQGNYTMGEQITKAYAAFGNVKVALTDQFAVRLGARYSQEKKSVDEEKYLDRVNPYPPFSGFFPPLPAGGVRQSQDKTWKSFTPSLSLEFQATPRLFMYATYSQGFKSGGFNLGNLQAPFAPEKIKDYEAGIRSDWLNGKLRANLSAFYYDYTDLQVSQVVGTSILIQNAASAKIYGLEGEFSLIPVENLRLGTTISLIHSEYQDFMSSDPARPLLGVLDLSGNQLTQAPKYTINVDAKYSIPMDSGKIEIEGNARFVGRNYLSFYNLEHVSQSPYGMYDAYLGWSGNNGLTVRAFVKNIANKLIVNAGFVSSALFAGSPLVGSFEPPRTYGLSVGYSF